MGCFLLTQGLFIDFREKRKGEGERQRNRLRVKHQSDASHACVPEPATWVHALIRSQTSDLSVCRTTLQPTELHRLRVEEGFRFRLLDSKPHPLIHCPTLSPTGHLS